MRRVQVGALVFFALCFVAFLAQQDYDRAIFRFEPDPRARVWSEDAAMPTRRLSPRSDYTFASSEPLLFMDEAKRAVRDYKLGAGSTLPPITQKATAYLRVTGRPQGGRSVDFYDLVRDWQQDRVPDLARACTFFNERKLTTPRALRDFLFALESETNCPSSKACAFYRDIVRGMLLKHFVRGRRASLPFTKRLEVEQADGEIKRVDFALITG